MPETASSNGQDIRYTLLGLNFFAKYILTLKKDPRHWSGNPRTPKGNCKLIIWINLLILSGGCMYRHTVLYEQRTNRIDKRIFCLSHLIYQKREKTRELRPIFWWNCYLEDSSFKCRHSSKTVTRTKQQIKLQNIAYVISQSIFQDY